MPLLIEAGAELDARDRLGHTALQTAVWKGEAGVFEILLAAGASPGQSGGWTVFHYAEMGEKHECVAALAAAGLDPNGRDRDGRTALLLASWRGRDAMIQALLAARADPDLADADGLAPLHAAARISGELGEDCVALLLEAGADPNATDRAGETPLDAARKGNNPGVIALLEEAVRAARDAEDPEGPRGSSPA